MPAPALARSRTYLALAVAALATSGAAGCGSDEPGRTATVGNTAPVEVVADEYSFDPETLVVKASAGDQPARINIELKNDGTLAHNLKLLDGDAEVGGTPTFEGGETRSASLRLKPGKYRMVCTVGDHEQLGMKGTLEVVGSKRPAGG